MGLLEKIFILFLFIFPTGVIARLQFSNGVAFSLNDLALVILVSSWLIYKIKNRNIRRNYLLLTSLTVFLLIGLLSLLLNFPNLGINKFLISSSYLLRFFGYSLLYFVVSDFSNKFKEKISKYMMLSGFIVIVFGYLQYFFFPSLKSIFYLGWDEHLYRMVSVFLDPNFAGAFFNIYLIFSLDFLRKRYKKISFSKSFILSLMSLLTLFAIYLTYSRSALIMLFISLTAYLYLIRKKKMIVVSMIFLILLIFISPKAFQTEGTNLLRTVSSGERISSLEVAIKIIKDNPVFGVGFDAYRYAQNKIGLNNIYWQTTHSGAGTDTSLIFVIATTGFIGFAFFLYLIYKMFYLAGKNLNKNGIILFSILLGLIAGSLFVNSLFFVFILEWVWIICGITENS